MYYILRLRDGKPIEYYQSNNPVEHFIQFELLKQEYPLGTFTEWMEQ